jgi:hypothetical protein
MGMTSLNLKQSTFHYAGQLLHCCYLFKFVFVPVVDRNKANNEKVHN